MKVANGEQSRGIRPWFAAAILGSIAVALIFVAYEGSVVAASVGSIAAWGKPYSILCAALPFAYLAVRGFFNSRADALADITQSASMSALVFFVLSALGVGFVAGWATALGPGIAACISAFGVPKVRRLLLWA